MGFNRCALLLKSYYIHAQLEDASFIKTAKKKPSINNDTWLSLFISILE